LTDNAIDTAVGCSNSPFSIPHSSFIPKSSNQSDIYRSEEPEIHDYGGEGYIAD